MTQVHCPLCHTRAVRRWRELDLWGCLSPSCRLVFRHPIPDQEEYVQLYRLAWTNAHQHTSETGGTDAKLARDYARRLARSLDVKDFEGLTILDVGAGRGNMTAALNKLGAKVYAVEPFGYEYMAERGHNVFRTVNDLPKDVSFDGIVSIDVLEHLAEPWSEVRSLTRRVDAGGWVYIATLNAQGLNARVYGSRWREILKPGHLHFFGPSALERILAQSGLKRWIRLRWFVQYKQNFPRASMQYVLQALRLDGELRYLAWKST